MTAVPGQLDLYSYAMAISGDGRIVVGSVSPGVGTGIGVVWTDGSPTWLRGLLADDAYEGVDAWGMSTDGNYIVGSARAPHPDVTWTTRHATLWRSPTEVVDLAPGTSSTSEAWAVSDDGETAVGYMDVFDSSVGRERWNAMIWTPATGTVLLADFLASAGVAVPSGIRLAAATDVSGDGLTIAGNAYDGVASEGLVGFVVRLPAPTCYADFNADGGIDGSDIEPFFVAWEGGEPAADVNQDGGVDMGDVQAFFTQWESGACGR
ncbi:MAG: hypothetical protein NTV94_06870 [Planctomycetota bacterium]|nr:hypothetical protein [Planctomycetota bacterium]